MTLRLHSDSQSAIDLANNPVYQDITKRINVQYHFICILLKVTGEDTHESKFCKQVDQGGHEGKAEDLLSLRGSYRVKIRS